MASVHHHFASLLRIDGVLLKICMFSYFFTVAWKCLFIPLLRDFGDLTPKWGVISTKVQNAHPCLERCVGLQNQLTDATHVHVRCQKLRYSGKLGICQEHLCHVIKFTFCTGKVSWGCSTFEVSSESVKCFRRWWGSKKFTFPIAKVLAYTTACTALQAVILLSLTNWTLIKAFYSAYSDVF